MQHQTGVQSFSIWALDPKIEAIFKQVLNKFYKGETNCLFSRLKWVFRCFSLVSISRMALQAYGTECTSSIVASFTSVKGLTLLLNRGKAVSNKCGCVAMGITDCARESTALHWKNKEVWNCIKKCWTWKKGSEQSSAASSPDKGYQSRSWKQAGNPGEAEISGVRGVTQGICMGNYWSEFRWIKWGDVIYVRPGSVYS